MKFLALMLVSLSAFAAENGVQAPAFTLQGVSGKTVNLSDYKGKTVVLEWMNHGCPFVKKHYGANNMQTLQKTYTDKGVVWLSIISSAEGKQGYVTAEEGAKEKKEHGSKATDVLLDPKGTVGQAYGAKTTPHMFVIDPKGTLVYQGAIDSNNSADPKDIPSAKNFVAAALDATLAGKAVEVPKTQSYGCSVKY